MSDRRCICGCGTVIPEKGKRGKPQFYAHGHNGRKPLGEMFRIEDHGFESPCWIWTGGTTGDGRYGRCRYRGKMMPAHCAFLIQRGVEIPVGYEPDHLCRVTLCVNPEHLEIVTRTENVRRSSCTKLSASQVAAIRWLRDELLDLYGPTGRGKRQRIPGGKTLREELGRDYGVTADQIKHIWGGRSWVN